MKGVSLNLDQISKNVNTHKTAKTIKKNCLNATFYKNPTNF